MMMIMMMNMMMCAVLEEDEESERTMLSHFSSGSDESFGVRVVSTVSWDVT